MFAAAPVLTAPHVAQLLDQASSEMDLGEMVCAENFDLYEAMSAMELMDPKMDAGMCSNSVPGVEARIESGRCLAPSSARVTVWLHCVFKHPRVVHADNAP